MLLDIQFQDSIKFLNAALILAKDYSGNPKDNRIQAQSFDVLRLLLIAMKDTTTRLNKRLKTYSEKYYQENASVEEEVDWNNPLSKMSDTGLIMSDIWNLIDTTHRLGEILKRMRFIPVSTSFNNMLFEIKVIRDSYQHLDERVRDFFGEEHCKDSVFGNITWRFRPNKSQVAFSFYLVSGITFESIGIPPRDGTWITPSNFVDHEGVFDLNIMYVKRKGTVKDKSHESATINIDNIVGQINLLLPPIFKYCDRITEAWKSKYHNNEIVVRSGASWPMGFRFFIHSGDQMAFNIIPTSPD